MSSPAAKRQTQGPAGRPGLHAGSTPSTGPFQEQERCGVRTDMSSPRRKRDRQTPAGGLGLRGQMTLLPRLFKTPPGTHELEGS